MHCAARLGISGARDAKFSVRNFEEKFCAIHGIAPENYVDAMLQRTLYPAARWLRPVLAWRPSYFTADRNFIQGVGRISRFSDFEAEVKDYLHDPQNRGIMRRGLKLRVSAYCMLRVVRTVLRDYSLAPFTPSGRRH